MNKNTCIFVSYKSDAHVLRLLNFINSIDTGDFYFIFICIGETDFEEEKGRKYEVVRETENLGYLGVVLKYINIKNEMIDYLCISNVDVNFEENFFIELSKIINVSATGIVIGPSIVNLSGLQQNPFASTKTQLIRKLLIWKIIYSNYYIGRMIYIALNIISRFKNLRSKKINLESSNAKQVYAVHGAFMCLPFALVSKLSKLPAIPLLWAEELIIAFESEKHGINQFVFGELKMTHLEGTSTGKGFNRFRYSEVNKVHKYISKYYLK